MFKANISMLIKLTFNKKFHFFGDRFKPIIISGDTLVCSRMMPADCLHDNIAPCHLELTWNVYCYKSSPHQDTDLCTQPDGILAPFFLHINLGSGWPSSTEHRNLTSSPSFTVMLFSGVVVILGLTGNVIISIFHPCSAEGYHKSEFAYNVIKICGHFWNIWNIWKDFVYNILFLLCIID